MQSGCAPCSASRAGAKTSPWHPLLLEPELGTSVGTQKKKHNTSPVKGEASALINPQVTGWPSIVA